MYATFDTLTFELNEHKKTKNWSNRRN
jgi:hypothetical protein